MKFYFKISIPILLFLSILIVQSVTDASTNPSKDYHDYSALTKALNELADQNKRISKLTSIGRTHKGKEIWMLQISGEKGTTPEEKQSLLICANLEGDHVIGSEVALGISQYLINNYGKDKEVTEILNKRSFYIIPRLNPDGAEFFFQKPLLECPGNIRPRDDDYDWKIDEDGPEDLNEDGMISLMRVKDKKGEWYIDGKDSRLMHKKEKDTPLDSLYKIYPEGIDNDGDEKYNEDGVGGFDINRNFPHNFGYQIKGYGVYPASEIETRTLIDFMNSYNSELKTQPHKSICVVLIFSKYDNLACEPGIECGQPTFPEIADEEEDSRPQIDFRFRRRRSPEGPSPIQSKDPQPKKTDDKDVHLFKKVGEKYKIITGIESSVSEKPVGSLLEWSYFQYGVPTFSSNLWSLRKEKKEKADTTDQKATQSDIKQKKAMDRREMIRQNFVDRMSGKGTETNKIPNYDEQWLTWIDKYNAGKGFVNWEKFKHKQLGEVEIGGFHPYLRINPPAEQIKSLSESHAKFALYLADQLAEIEMDEPEIEKLSSNLYRLKVRIHNQGKFPYAIAMGQRSRNVTPIMLQLNFEDDENMKLFGGSKRENIRSLDAGKEKEFKWIIISPPEKTVDITLWARKGGGKFHKRVILN